MFLKDDDKIRKVFKVLKNGFYLVKMSKYRYFHYYPDCEVSDHVTKLCDGFLLESDGAHIPINLYGIMGKEKEYGYTFDEDERTYPIKGDETIYGYIWITGKSKEPILKSVIKMKGISESGEIEWRLL